MFVRKIGPKSFVYRVVERKKLYTEKSPCPLKRLMKTLRSKKESNFASLTEERLRFETAKGERKVVDRAASECQKVPAERVY